MHILLGGRLRVQKLMYLPGLALEKIIELLVSRFLFTYPHRSLQFDTGCYPEVAASPEGHWRPVARSAVPAVDNMDIVVN